MSLLRSITGPADLAGLSSVALAALAQEIRQFLVAKVSEVGGHLGSNLGVVELTIVVHRVFNSPCDVLLFDTGHQAYVHKILTGRWAEFGSLRQVGGLSGYPCRTESVHDVIENSHASTALSYADGLAKAFALHGITDRRVVAIIGDGALTGGMCWEALNNLGAAPGRPVIIVLNDNGRSYSPTIGGVASHLAGLRLGRANRHTVFENLGLSYLGPVDGHDIVEIESALRAANELNHPVVVHCVTRKGSGYPPAEQDDTDHLHAVGVIDPSTGQPRCPGRPTWTSVFAEEITAIGAERSDVVCVTAAMLHPTGLDKFAARFPDRVFDVGIAEQHAVTSAAGLAIGGLHPVLALYSTFVSRAFDQLLMDVALHRLPVTVVLDRAGITGPDGPSHHDMWDSSILPIVPGSRIAAPRDCTGLHELLREAIAINDGPTVIRYPKATAGPDISAIGRIGQCDVLRDDLEAIGLLVAVGALAGPCLTAAQELAAHNVPVTVVDPRWIAPLDPALLTLAAAHRLVLAVEDATTTGALGSRIAQALAAAGSDTCAATFALPPRFLPHATRDQTLHAHGLDGVGIATAVLKRLASTHRGKVRKGHGLRRSHDRCAAGHATGPGPATPSIAPGQGRQHGHGRRGTYLGAVHDHHPHLRYQCNPAANRSDYDPVVSCPSCERAQVDVYAVAEQVTAAFSRLSHAAAYRRHGMRRQRFGRSARSGPRRFCGQRQGQIFVRGEVIKTVPEDHIVQTLIDEARQQNRTTLSG